MVMFGTKGAVDTKAQVIEQVQPTLSKPRAVQSAADLLKPHRHQLQLERIKELAHVPEYYYQHFYLPAILQVAEFVQLLPAARIAKFNKAGGLLDFTLRRTLATLDWYRRENPVRNKDPEKVSPDDAHMTWALFSAALMLGLGYIPTQYWVSLCQEDGTFLCRWQPLLGSMQAQGQWYRCGIEPAFDNLAHRNTLLLADMLLPKEALAWLSGNKDLFNAWLALLAGDLVDGGLFAKFVMPAEWQLLEHAQPSYEGDMPPSLLPAVDEWAKPTQEATPTPTADETPGANTGLGTETAPYAQQLSVSALAALKTEELSGAAGAAETGQAFIEWLRNGIEGQSIRADGLRSQANFSVNGPHALIQRGQDGVHLLIGELAKAFGKQTGAIVAGLAAMGVPFHNAAGGHLVIQDPTIVFRSTMPGMSANLPNTTGPAYPAQPGTTASADLTFTAPKPLMR